MPGLQGGTLTEGQRLDFLDLARRVCGLDGGAAPVEIASSPGLGEAENAARLVQVGQVLQLGLEVQAFQVEEMENDYADKVDALAQELETVERENDELKDQLDAAQGAPGNVGELAEVTRRANILEQDLQEEKLRAQRLERENRTLERENLDFKTATDRAAAERAAAAKENTELKERLRAAEDDLQELRSHLATEQKRSALRGDDEKGIASRLNQRTRDLDRAQRENQELEKTNAELSAKVEELQAELLQLSETVVRFDDEQRNRAVEDGEFESILEDTARERESLAATVGELERNLEDKVRVIKDMESRYQEDFASWQAEREAIAAEISGSTAMFSARRPATPSAGDPEDEAGSGQLHKDLSDAQDKIALLLDAYEQLEKDTGREVDYALERQKDKLDKLEAEAKVRDDALAAERERFKLLDKTLAQTQEALEEANGRNRDYEAGIYGLPEAMQDIKKLRGGAQDLSARLEATVSKMNSMSESLEDLLEENRHLRHKLGIPESQGLEMTDFRLQSQVTIAQLRSLNAQLEREVMDMEEDRRKLRMELRFRAKWQGKNAMTMGLTHDQLVLLEEYADALRYGGAIAGQESKLLADYARQVSLLQERLAEARAAADLGEDLEGGEGVVRVSTVLKSSLEVHTLQDAASTLRQRNMALTSQVHALQNAVTLAEQRIKAQQERVRDSQDSEGWARWNSILSALKVEGGAGGTGVAAFPDDTPLTGSVSILGEAELRERIAQLEAKLAAQAAEIEAKDLSLQLVQREASFQRQSLDGKPASGTPPAAVRTGGNLESQSLSTQLLECLGELEAKTAELNAVGPDLQLYRNKLQALVDQRALLYQEFAKREAQWAAEKAEFEGRVDRLEADQAADRARCAELERSVAAESASGGGDVQDLRLRLRSTFARLAVLQVRYARATRALSAANAAEGEVRQERETLREDMAAMAGHLRARIRFLEQAKGEADRRLQRATAELQKSVPKRLFDELREQRTALEADLREAMERRTNALVLDSELAKAQRRLGAAQKEALKWQEQHEGLKMEAAEAGRAAAALKAGGDEVALLVDQMRAEVASLKASELNAGKRVQLAEATARRAEDGAKELNKRVEELEATAERSARALHEAREAQRAALRGAADAVSLTEFNSVVERCEAALARCQAAETELAEQRGSVSDLRTRLVAATAESGDLKTEALRLRQGLRALSADAAGGGGGDPAQGPDARAAFARMAEEASAARAAARAARAALEGATARAQEAGAEAEELRADAQEVRAQLDALQARARRDQEAAARALARAQGDAAGRVDAATAQRWSRGVDAARQEAAALPREVQAAREAAVHARGTAEGAELRARALGDVRELVKAAPGPANKAASAAREAQLKAEVENRRLARQLEVAEAAADFARQQVSERASMNGIRPPPHPITAGRAPPGLRPPLPTG